MNSPLLSIIVPSFNQGAFIANTLLSIVHQDYQHWEIIIQDGGSSDQTHDAVKPFVEKDSRISFQSEKDKGFSDAVNKALLRCNGDYAIIQNSDDFFSGPHVFTEAVNYLARYPELHILSAPFIRVDDQFNELLVQEEKYEEGFIDPMDIYKLKRTFGQSSTFFSLKRIREIGLLSLSVDMVADTDTWIRLAVYDPIGEKRIYYGSQTWSCATFHPQQRSSDQSKFMTGRAQMFTDLVFNQRVSIDISEKKRVAVVFIADAFEYLISRKMDTGKLEEMYKKVTGQSLPVRKKLKQGLFRIGGIRSLIKGPIEKDGTDYFLNFPRGKNYKWFVY